MLLDLRYLRYAALVAAHGSFRKAAIVSELSQSTISRRVQILERRLGFPIFERDRNGARLTHAGANFLEDAMVSALRIDRAASTAAATHRGEKGNLHVGIQTSLMDGHLQDVLRRFRKMFPQIQINLQEGTSSETLQAITQGKIDASFAIGLPDIVGYTSEVIWCETIYVVLPIDHPLRSSASISWNEIKHEKFLVSGADLGLDAQDALIDVLRTRDFEPLIDAQGVSRHNLLNLVAAGYGIMLASTSELRDDVKHVAFVPIADQAERLLTRVIWSTSNANPALKQLLKVVDVVSRSVCGVLTAK